MRIAVLGCGEMGSAHARIYAGRLKKQVELAMVFSRNPARARTLAKEVGARPTTRPQDILADDSIDAVDLCIPSAYHRKFGVRALEQGKHVFSETPMALTVSDADAMIAAARRSRRVLAVAQVMRFVAPYVRAKTEVASGRFGTPNIVVARRLSRPYWARKRRRPFREYGEPLLELSIHDIDVANWILGRPTSVLASGVIGKSGVAEHVLLAINYQGGTAYVEGSGMMPQGFPFTTALRVQCERGVIDLQAQFLQGPIPKEQFHVYAEDGRTSIRVGGRDPYEEECAAFVRCIEKRAEPITQSAVQERDALRVAAAAQQSLRSQGPVQL